MGYTRESEVERHYRDSRIHGHRRRHQRDHDRDRRQAPPRLIRARPRRRGQPAGRVKASMIDCQCSTCGPLREASGCST
ncbi:hypothetical protein ACI790_19490 [Blastococcus sp. SYSU DS0539]